MKAFLIRNIHISIVMKAIKTITLYVISVFLLAAGGCTEEPGPNCKKLPDEITTSAGSSSGGKFSLSMGGAGIWFDNTNLTLYVTWGTYYEDEIVDAGTTCLDKITEWPGNGSKSPIAVKIGHTYVARTLFTRWGETEYNYAKFTADSYQNGVLTVTYVAHL